MSWMQFEPTIPAFERAKSVDALDRAASVIGPPCYTFKFTCRCGGETDSLILWFQTGLLYQFRVIIMEQWWNVTLQCETEIIEEMSARCYFFHPKSQSILGLKLGFSLV
jgi:hypothetical protein